MKTMLAATLFAANLSSASALTDSVFYNQNVIRHVPVTSLSKFVKNRRGIVELTSDSLVFHTRDEKNSTFDFALHYKNIRYIRSTYRHLFPNRIRIKTSDARVYMFVTFKKRKLIRLVRQEVKQKWSIRDG